MEDGTEVRDDRWIVRTGLYADLIEVAFETHQNEAETLSSILERIRRERERRNRDIGEERTRGNDGHQPPPPPQPPPWPPPPPQPPPHPYSTYRDTQIRLRLSQGEAP